MSSRYDGSGDQSAFAPAGYGMDAQTAVDDGESITSSVEKMLHPPKPKLRPVLSGVVVGKDGQKYDSIPADIMSKFRQARKGALGDSAAPSRAPTGALAPRSTADKPPAAQTPEASANPPAWVLAEAKKLQAKATANGGMMDAAAPKASATSTRPVADTYDQYKAEYEAALKARARPTAAVARGGATRTEIDASSSGVSVKQTAQELGRLQARVARQQDERQDELEHLASDVKALTQAVIKMKQRQARGGSSRAPVASADMDKPGRSPAAMPAADGKAEWEALQSRLHASRQAGTQVRGRVAPAAANGELAGAGAKMSFFGLHRLMRQQRGGAQAARAPASPRVRALGDKDDLSVGYREQQERDAEMAASGQQRHTAAASSRSRSKLSFFAQMRNSRREASGGGGSTKMAALHRILARTAAGGFFDRSMEVPVPVGGGGATALSLHAPPAAPQCVSPGCTCVPPGNQAVRVANSPLALTQLHGLGAQAHCVYYTVHGPNGHALSVRLLRAGDDKDASWSNYGSVATGCISSAVLVSTSAAPRLAVQDTVTGDRHSFALHCSH